jgi:hypothetical protein
MINEFEDKMLVMVDGCAICGSENAKTNTEVTIALVNTWPAGSLFTKCKEEKHTAGFVGTWTGTIGPSVQYNSTIVYVEAYRQIFKFQFFKILQFFILSKRTKKKVKAKPEIKIRIETRSYADEQI